MKKQILATMLGATMVMGLLTGCGGSAKGDSKASNTVDSQKTVASASNTVSSASGDAASTASAVEEYTKGDPMTIKIATVLTENSVSGRALQKFSDDLAAKTDGRIKCDIYYNGVLADTESCFEMLQKGDIQMMTLNPVAYETQVTELSTLDEYYMFDDLEHAHRFLEGDGGKFLNDAWNSVNLQGMAVYGLGFRELSNNKKDVKTIDDMKGMTIRGYSTIQIDAWNAIGASPTSVDWNELFVSMQQGLLDGQESALSTMNDFSFYEVQKHVSLTDHVFTMDYVVGSKTWLDGLNATDRKVIDETMQESYEWQKENYMAELENLQKTFTDEYGVTITELDDSVKAEMKEKMQPVTVELIKQTAGEDVYNKVHGYVEEARA